MFRQCTRVALRPFVLCARTRSALPRRLFPSELLRASFSSSSVYHSEVLSALSSHPSAPLQPTSSSDPAPLSTPTISAKDPSLLFSTLAPHIHPATLKAITVRPFQHTHMSPVQAQILPLLPTLALPASEHPGASPAHPRDLLVKAKTGTGKTMAFLVPAIEARARALAAHVASLASSGVPLTPAQTLAAEAAYARDHVGCLIISPTRELAAQIAVEASSLTAHHPGWQTQILLGGESKHRQMRAWKGRKDIVVATPGRVLDLLNTEPSVARALATCNLLILDEADTLLDMGFRDDIARLTTFLPPSPQRQTFLFSATVSRAIQQVAQATLAPSHKFVNCVGADDSPVHAHIPQYHTVLERGDDVLPHVLRLIACDQLMYPGSTGVGAGSSRGRGKTPATTDGAAGPQNSKIIIFLSTTNMVQLFTSLLRKALFPPSSPSSPTHLLPTPPSHTSLFELHSKLPMPTRTRVSSSFRASPSACSILVTSDVSARGVDYPGVTRVVQVGVPSGRDVYVHRVGRTGRGAAKIGRGDLVLASWEMGFVAGAGRTGRGAGGGALADVGLKPITKEGVVDELAKLAEKSAATLATSNPAHPHAHFGPAKIAELDRAARELAHSFTHSSPSLPPSRSSSSYNPSPDTNHPLILSAFSSYTGFFLGHASSLGLSLPAVIAGLKAQFQEMWGLEREPWLGRGMAEMVRGALSGGGGGGGGGRRDMRGGYGRDRGDRERERGAYDRRPRSSSQSSFFSSSYETDQHQPTFSAHHSTSGPAGFPRGGRQGAAHTRAGTYARGGEGAWERGGEGYMRGRSGSGARESGGYGEGARSGGYEGRSNGYENESRGAGVREEGEGGGGGGYAKQGHQQPWKQRGRSRGRY